jgi:predicted nucleotidyltransferase
MREALHTRTKKTWDRKRSAIPSKPTEEKNMPLDELVQARREDILQIASRYGAYNVRIFGSVARRETDERSDLDLLVDMETGRSLFDLGGLLVALEDLLGCPVDVVTEQGLRDRIRDRVLQEAVPL